MSKQPRPLVAANWKMNGTRSSARTWAETMSGRTMSNALECDIVVSPPMPLFDAVYQALTKSGAISLCGQDCATQGNGPHTGDTSVEMLVEAGCRYVLVGHSERRGGHGESNSIVKAKATRALAHGLIPIICVGETQAQRDAGRAIQVVRSQMRRSLPDLTSGIDVVIAYEPVWAIGTGRVPELAEISEIHDSIRKYLLRQAQTSGGEIRIIYGGSVKAMNAKNIMRLQNVNGCLVGGASLDEDDFWSICMTCDNLQRSHI